MSLLTVVCFAALTGCGAEQTTDRASTHESRPAPETPPPPSSAEAAATRVAQARRQPHEEAERLARLAEARRRGEEAQRELERRAAAEQAELSRVLALTGSTSTSLGGPNAGDLQGGVALPLRGPGFRFNPRRSETARFGTVELVQALIRAAGRTHERVGGRATINDIGFQAGGPIRGHGSHQAGRDVDVLFYVTTPDGTSRPSVGAIIDPTGYGVDFRDLATEEDDVPVQIDLPRTWAFVESLLLDEAASVQRAFVAEHIRTMLLRHARDHGGDAGAIARFAEITCQPGYPHDDHFHFRFFCTPQDIAAGCRDSPPMYPWRRRQLRAAGTRPRMAGPERRRAPTTTHAEARAAAGPLHPEVERWLSRRRAWRDRPHPGRRWCR